MMKLLCFAPLLAACSSGGSLREPDEYVGCATDELWATFDAAREIPASADAPQLVAPAPGATVPSSPIDFTWHATPTVEGSDAGDVAMSCAQWNTGYATLHLPPVSGTVYDLQLLAHGEIRWRVLTTLQKWRPSPDTWSIFAGASITVKLRRMAVVANEGKDVYVPAAPVTLRVMD